MDTCTIDVSKILLLTKGNPSHPSDGVEADAVVIIPEYAFTVTEV